MQVRILGAHCCESRDARPVSVLIDGVLCIDTGSLTTALTIEEQRGVRAILLTHRHFDHVKGVPTFGINTAEAGVTGLYSIPEVLAEVRQHLINGTIYPTFTEAASFGGPSLEYRPIEALRDVEIEGYRVRAVPVKHGVPAVGYQVTSREGRSVFYTGDTCGQLAETWEAIAPDLLITEVTYPDAWRGKAKHMAPADLEAELETYRRMKGSLPRVLIVHMVPWLEHDVRRELAGVAGRLGHAIEVAREDMLIEV